MIEGTDEMIALTQVTPPYDWEGWSDTLDDIRDLDEVTP